ncbi:MAG: M24 family metallopeptidase, partial [Parafannyhessea sp.]|uniref:M24 family metallopeptidase n=1 Tax=Parafannyhessea sp. TaxID=2847324 RepID=UPI003F0081FC
MADTKACLRRVERLRALMADRGYDAVIIRNNPDLRWLTGAERTFDDETAHTAFVTADGLWLHTDSRYYGTFLERMGEDSGWTIDMDIVSPAWWAAHRVLATKSRVVGVEDSLDLAFFDAFRQECNKASVDCLNPRMHDDIADKLRVVKDEEELALMRRAQEITDDAYDHICGYIKPGMTEQQIRVELETYMLTHGADSISFDSIIASGPNGANPHAQPGERKVQKGDMIVMD